MKGSLYALSDDSCKSGRRSTVSPPTSAMSPCMEECASSARTTGVRSASFTWASARMAAATGMAGKTTPAATALIMDEP